MLRCISAADRPKGEPINLSGMLCEPTIFATGNRQNYIKQMQCIHFIIEIYTYIIYSRSQLSQVRKFLLDADYVAPLWLRASRTSSGSAENLKCCKIHRNGRALSKIFPGRLFNFRADSFGNEMKRSRRGNWVIIAKDEPGAGPNLLYRTFKIII